MIQRRNGTIKNNRLPEDLLDAPFQIDQRSFWEIMGYIALYLEKINYYNLKNQQEGNWKVIIEGDSIMYMAMIINHPIKNIEELMQRYENNTAVDSDMKREIEVLLGWYDEINHWYYRLMELGEKRLAYKIKNIVVDVLLPEKSKILRYEQNQQEKTLQERTSTLTFAPSPYSIDEEIQPKKTLSTFHRIIIHIKEFVKEYLEENIYDSASHRPNNAMYIAFVLLFKKAQSQLNELSRKHLDFYYKEILKQQPSTGKPTKAIVNFELLPNITNTLIPKKALLSAGKLFESKTDILFEVGKPLMVHKIALTQMETLLFNVTPYINVGTNSPIISYVAKNDMIIDGKQIGTIDDWFAFGANKQSIQNTNIPENQLASIGFIIGSPVLFLSEGTRKIELRIDLEETTSHKIFWKLLKQIKRNKKTSLETVFYKVFSQAFKISFTTKKGWTDFDHYTVNYKYDKQDKYFSIHLMLNSGDPMLEKITKTNECLTWPSIKIVLNEYAPVYAYSFLKGVKVDTIQINVEAHDVKDLVLYNNVGKMPLGKPFDLFGPLPSVESYLIIGENELFEKKIGELDIILDWANVPSEYGGLKTYYEDYPDVLDNNSFKVDFNALSNGQWVPINNAEAPIFNLFQISSCLSPEGYASEQLNSSTKIEITDFNMIVTDQEYNPTTPLVYTVNSQSGFIRLQLVSPQAGFGIKAYEDQYVKIATYNARAIVKGKPQIPFPNKPFIPKVKGIAMNYKASDNLFFKPNPDAASKAGDNIGEFMHITPFGTETIIAQNKGIQKHTLLPSFEAEGYLFLGFSGVLSQTTISLYFHFLHSSTAVNLSQDALLWQYYDNDEWKKLGEKEIILDGTNGFTKSGIVELIFPKKILDSEEIPDETYWIRISTKENSIHYPKIKGIYPNAVEAICTDHSSTIIGKEIPANSIVKVVGKFPDIKAVNQAEASYGGTPIELPNQFYTRVSERLRHKSRALSIWDYERLVLENFEDVLVAKCTNFNESFIPTPGIVKVIVLSTKWTNDERNYFDGETLNNIKVFLKKLSSPFATITVMNPQVEYLLVNCIVKFKAEDNGGYYLMELNDDISSFLSPIANIDNGTGGIGGNIVPTMLVSYIEKRPYIDLVHTLTIEHLVRKGLNDYSVGIYTGGEEIKTTTPEAILSPEQKHRIISLGIDNNSPNILDLGIGGMEIGLDFILESTQSIDSHNTKKSSKKVEPLNADLTENAILMFENKT